jgi:chitin synthase
MNGLFTQKTFIYLLICIVGIHSIIVFTALSFSTYWEILTSAFSYFFYAPSYINLFFIYAFCRIDDLSWGTKGLDSEKKSK